MKELPSKTRFIYSLIVQNREEITLEKEKGSVVNTRLTFARKEDSWREVHTRVDLYEPAIPPPEPHRLARSLLASGINICE